jgi:hypothetical protein
MAYQTQMLDALLTALAQVLVKWLGSNAVRFDLEGHGREDIFDGVDLSRTVGWFTSLFPVCIELAPESHVGEALKTVKEQLRRMPNRGIGYGLLRYLCQDAKVRNALQRLPRSELSFNYLGRLDREASTWVQLSDAPRGEPRSSRGARPYLLEINRGLGSRFYGDAAPTD